MNNPELDLAFNFVQYTNRNLFLTGKAGTGKTTFLHKLREISPKRMIVVAPTGVAAINAGGVTIHSFFQMPFGPILPGRLDAKGNLNEKSRSFLRFNKRKINIIRSLDLLVIDEISMVRADLLDGIDHVLRRFRDRRKPFGGVQLLMIGDLQQLAPVVKEDEWSLLREHYETIYFFSSKAFRQSAAVSIELKHVYRQQDSRFIKILNEIRDNRLTAESIEILNSRYQPGFSPEKEEGYITLTTHNAIANRINQQRLQQVNARAYTFEAEVNGNFPVFSYPADEFLMLKVGAQVMFNKNDSSPEKRYYNGKIGTVQNIADGKIYVVCEGDEEAVEVDRAMWENMKYTINENSREIEEEVAGSFVQYPLKLAWAITIHKSQGLTFDRAVIDAEAAFAHGQTYVALSRCKSLEGLVLSSPLSNEGIICDPTIGHFNAEVESHQPDEDILRQAREAYLIDLFDELFGFGQLKYYFEKLKKTASEHQNSILGNLGIKLNEVMEQGLNPLNIIADKFINQLKYLINMTGIDGKFRERVKKGADYFYGQVTENIEKPLKQIRFETDNKEVDKAIREISSNLSELLNVKKKCLSYCRSDFELKDYLKVRAVAALEPVSEMKREVTEADLTSSENPELFERIKAWRHLRAREENVPHFRVISQRAAVGISSSLPGNISQLLKVKGMGKKKVEKYGEELLALVSAFCNEKDIAANLALPEVKKKKKDTKTLTLELFREGKTVPQIAGFRNLTVGTIEGHLSYFIAKGELDIALCVDSETRKKITGYFLKHPNAGLSEARTALDDSISYGELRMVRASMSDKLNA